MKKIIVIGCPGSGKSTFSKKLSSLTRLPLYHLDLIYHKENKETISKEEFDKKLDDVLSKNEWIIDGNYSRTLRKRLSKCDTVFLLDYPTEVCIEGLNNRVGVKRDDMPWVEEKVDEEFKEYVLNFRTTQLPKIYELLDNCEGKDIYMFKNREECDEYLEGLL